MGSNPISFNFRKKLEMPKRKKKFYQIKLQKNKLKKKKLNSVLKKFFRILLKNKKKKKKLFLLNRKKKLIMLYFLQKPILKITLLRTKNNYFFIGARSNGNILFWFTGKQLGFKRRQLKSPYTLEVFNEFFFYLLRKYKIFFLVCQYYGKKKLFKEIFYKLVRFKYFFLTMIKQIPNSFNGCKVRHIRRL
jgi:hypothetical protein